MIIYIIIYNNNNISIYLSLSLSLSIYIYIYINMLYNKRAQGGPCAPGHRAAGRTGRKVSN